MKFIKCFITIFIREYKISLRNFNELFSSLLFFFLSIFIFIFAIGSDKEILNSVGVGILWSLLILSSTLSLKKYYQNDFENGNLIIMNMAGISYEFISIIKIFSNFIFVKLPFLISLPLAGLMINLPIDKTILFLISFSLGSFILSCLGSIASSMNLLNKTSFSIGSLIVMLFSIPIIIFSIGLINSEQNYISILNIIFGILLIFIAISPWTTGYCIRLAIENQ